MFSKLILGITSVLATENQRKLAAGGAAAAEGPVLIDFKMDYKSNEGYKFHYANYGEDWAEIEGLASADNQCGAEVQSPINVMEPIGSYGWAYGYPKAKVDEMWDSNYADVNDVLVEWDYNKIQVTFSQEDASKMFFQSNFAETLYGGQATRFQPTHLVLKSPSEHTKDGVHYDVEMQVFHTAGAVDSDAENDIKYGATAIFFSVEEFDAIDEATNKTFQDFFRQFEFENTEDKVAPFFNIGEALNAVDFTEKWIYKGAISEPPCTEGVYWNIVKKIYPMEIERYELLKDFLYAKKGYLGSYKNNRKIQSVHQDSHQVAFVSAIFFKKAQIFAMAISSLMAYTLMY